MRRPTRTVALLVALALQVALALGVVAPRLVPRLAGDEYLLRVEPFDPIDPFRGAYVDLRYPGFEPLRGVAEDAEVFVPLVRDGEAWRGGGAARRRPVRGPFVACRDGNLRPACGIESLFLSQESARRAEGELAGGRALARVRIDGAGRAALLGLEPR